MAPATSAIGQLTVIGVGLIGGSLARALKRAGYCRTVVGCSRDPANLAKALELDVVDRATPEMADAVRDADVVVVAVPVLAAEGVFRELEKCLPERAIVTDVGSVKGAIVDAAERAFGSVPPRFVPGHPIAGTEHSGVEASFAELYDRRRVILTPLQNTDPEALSRVKAMWQAAGALVDVMSVAHHDEVLAATSHLPHVLAYSLVDTLVNLDETEEIFRFAAGGFRDFTRIASSDPVMWHDICLANRDAIVKVLRRFVHDLQELELAIEAGDGEILKQVFSRAKSARDRFCNS